MHRINTTLLEKLFIAPAPLSGDKSTLEIYNRLKGRMFPGEKTFIEFLSAQNNDSQFEYAEAIIHRLCFESNYPPSFFAIKDIVTVEEYQKRNISELDSYIPRDHFLHIVNLYLLGIYIFFYNSEFHNRIIRDNRFQRRVVYNGQYRIDCYKDFISEWKYFCLFHDIGYIPELFANELLIDNPLTIHNKILSEHNDFCDSLSQNQIINQTAFFGSIEILSRILAWELIKSASKANCNGEDKMFRFFKDSEILSSTSNEKTIDFHIECEPFLKDMTILDRIYSNACLKPLLPIIGENNLAIVGIDRITGEVAFLSFAANNQRKLFYTRNFSRQNEYAPYIKKPSMLLFDDFAPSHYEFVYLCNIKNSDKQFPLSDLFPDTLIQKAVTCYAEKGFEITLASAANEEELLQFYYDLYIDLYHTYRDCLPFVPSNKNETHSDIYNILYAIGSSGWKNLSSADQKTDQLNWGYSLSGPIQKYVLQHYSEELSNICQNALNKECKPDSEKTDYNDIKDKISSYLSEYHDKINELVNNDSRKQIFIEKIAASEKAKLESKEALLTLYSQSYYMLFHILDSVVPKSHLYRYNYKTRQSYVNMSFCQDHIPRKIDNKDITIQKLMADYINNLTKDNNKYKKAYKQAKTIHQEREALSKYRSKCDHGFESAKYAGSMFDILKSALKKTKGKEPQAIIDILFSLSNKDTRKTDIQHCVEDYEHIFRNVIYAIFIHNIWPDKLGLKLDTTIVREPFAYFALMCDSLQQWNRPQGLSHSLSEFRPYKAASEEYNIIAESNQILLYEAKTKEMQTRIEKSINNMNDYLKNIKAVVKSGNSAE